MAASMLEGYPRAKRFLIARGRSPAEVEAMPVPQVILLYTMQNYDELRDDMFKWLALPYPEARRGLEQVDRKLRDGSGCEIIPLARLLLPALQACKHCEARTDRNIVALEVLEALRLYAADHDGRLPDSSEGHYRGAHPAGPAFEASRSFTSVKETRRSWSRRFRPTPCGGCVTRSSLIAREPSHEDFHSQGTVPISQMRCSPSACSAAAWDCPLCVAAECVVRGLPADRRLAPRASSIRRPGPRSSPPGSTSRRLPWRTSILRALAVEPLLDRIVPFAPWAKEELAEIKQQVVTLQQQLVRAGVKDVYVLFTLTGQFAWPASLFAVIPLDSGSDEKAIRAAFLQPLWSGGATFWCWP